MIQWMKAFAICSVLAMSMLAAQTGLAQDNVGIFQTYIVVQVDTPANVFYAGGENADCIRLKDDCG